MSKSVLVLMLVAVSVSTKALLLQDILARLAASARLEDWGAVQALIPGLDPDSKNKLRI